MGVHPESYGDLATAATGISSRVAADSTGAYAQAPAIHDAAAKVHGVPGTRGRWKPVGRGPLLSNDPTYPNTYGEGFGTLAGRISDYTYDAKHKIVYASVASGGVWMSKDTGQHWRSIGNKLPTQTVGSIAYSPSHGGTLIAVTGDNAFGGNTYGGLGVFRSTDRGRHWKRAPRACPPELRASAPRWTRHTRTSSTRQPAPASSAPPTTARASRTSSLPIQGKCRGLTFTKPNCFFANIVTDVVVESKDKFGHKDGTVLAAVGWRAGNRKNFNGAPESALERPLPLEERQARQLQAPERRLQRLRAPGEGRPRRARRGHRARTRTTPTSTRWSRTPASSTAARSRASTCPAATRSASASTRRRRPPTSTASTSPPTSARPGR